MDKKGFVCAYKTAPEQENDRIISWNEHVWTRKWWQVSHQPKRQLRRQSVPPAKTSISSASVPPAKTSTSSVSVPPAKTSTSSASVPPAKSSTSAASTYSAGQNINFVGKCSTCQDVNFVPKWSTGKNINFVPILAKTWKQITVNSSIGKTISRNFCVKIMSPIHKAKMYCNWKIFQKSINVWFISKKSLSRNFCQKLAQEKSKKFPHSAEFRNSLLLSSKIGSISTLT